MKTQWAPLFFVVSLGLGWMARDAMAPGPRNQAAHRRTANAEEKPPVHLKGPGPDTRWKLLAAKAKEFSDQEMENFIRNLASSDRIPMLEALVAQGGPQGLDHKLLSLFDRILAGWAEEDFDSAWSWSQGTRIDTNRAYMTFKLLDILLSRDPDRALGIYLEQRAADPNFSSEIPSKVCELRTREGAARFLDLIIKLGFDGSFGNPSPEYAEDFDFRLAATGVAAMMEAERKRSARPEPPDFSKWPKRSRDQWSEWSNANQPNRKPNLFPVNFLSEWAKRDPEGAYAWWAENPSLPYGDGHSLLAGVEQRGDSKDSAAWVAAKLSEEGAARGRMIADLGLGFHNRRITIGTLSSISQAMSDTAAQDRFFTDLMLAGYGQGAEFLSGLSSPQARLDAFRKMKEANRQVDPDSYDATQLEAWGISRQQVDEIFKTGNEQ